MLGGSIVCCNNFRHPALLAREAASVDILSDGRLEFGIGAGYDLPEYHQTGIPLPDRGERVCRLREALAVVKGLWADGPFSLNWVRAAAELAPRWGLTEEQVLASPYFLIGSQASITEDVLALRDRHGISHLTVFPDDAETFAQVVAKLAGT